MSKPRRVYDGVEVPCTDPITYMMPYIMPRRSDSLIFFNFRLELAKMEAFIRSHQEEMPGLALYHVVFAIIVRCCAEIPQVNRFVSRGRVYQRDRVRLAMTIKKSLSVDAPEGIITPTFEKNSSLKEIFEITKKELEMAIAELDNPQNDVDKLCSVLKKLPGFLLRFIAKWLFRLDERGRLPKSLVNALPFHSSFYVTNVGSIGLPVIYHHLYEFGTVSGFVAIGKKETDTSANRDGEIVRKKVLPMKMVMDERICDGYTFGKAYKLIMKCFEHPEILLEGWKPEVSE